MINENELLNNLIERYPNLEICKQDIFDSYKILEKCFENGNKLLIAGNGGSAADSLHIVGELMKSFVGKRRILKNLSDSIDLKCKHSEYLKNNLQMPLQAIALVSEISLITAFSNDVNSDLIFAQQVLGYGNENDVLLAISTSGNSKNIVYAAEIAKAKNMKIIGLSGVNGGYLNSISDVCIKVPEKETYIIQELHLPIYHYLCLELENHFFNEEI